MTAEVPLCRQQLGIHNKRVAIGFERFLLCISDSSHDDLLYLLYMLFIYKIDSKTEWNSPNREEEIITLFKSRKTSERARENNSGIERKFQKNKHIPSFDKQWKMESLKVWRDKNSKESALKEFLNNRIWFLIELFRTV
jgi:hypothetical protein